MKLVALSSLVFFQLGKMQTFNDLPTVSSVLQSDVLSFVCANVMEGEENLNSPH